MRTKLKARIIERYGTVGKFADDMGLTIQTVSAMLNDSVWRECRVRQACKLLDIPKGEIGEYFFPDMEG